jgi:adenylate cyclase
LADIRKDQWNWAGAESEYRRAIDLSPSLAVARDGFAIYLSVMGKFDEGIAQVEKARELDPLGVPTAVDASAVYYNARRYKQSLDVLKVALDLDPSASAAWTWIGIVNGGSGQFERATYAYNKAIELGDNTTATLCYQTYSLARSGRRQESLQILKQLKSSHQFVSGAALAVSYLGLGDPERAIQELQAAFAARDPLVQYLKVESHFDALSSDPRFRELCTKIGLPR